MSTALMFSATTIRTIFKNRPYLSTYTIPFLLHACYMLGPSHPHSVTGGIQSRNFATVRDLPIII